jgi:muramoyltetrapeptide carboxypeptidase LdcA involved in peptidoglycan recycling
MPSAPNVGTMLKPRALNSGDRLAVVAPASPFDRDDFTHGVDEIRRLGLNQSGRSRSSNGRAMLQARLTFAPPRS